MVQRTCTAACQRQTHQHREEERRIQALRGPPYDEIRALVAEVLEFARTAPLVGEGETD